MLFAMWHADSSFPVNRDDFQSRWRLSKATNDFYQPVVAFQDDL